MVEARLQTSKAKWLMRICENLRHGLNAMCLAKLCADQMSVVHDEGFS